jgi:CubicO group peptidase (beta-lactamase class C family)
MGLGGASTMLFDLASLTKPMTAVALARSGVRRAASLAEYCPDLADTASAAAPIELLLAHRAGLEAHLPLFAPLLEGHAVDPDAALRAASNARRDDARGPYPIEGFPPVYSDLGYALAGAALARAVSTRDAGEAIARLVVRPLGLETSLGTVRDLREAGALLGENVAPTEVVPFRGGEVRAAVHDENAWALTGEGGSGHAGMFGTVGAVTGFGVAVLDALGGRGPFADADLGWLVRERPGGSLRSGFDGKSVVGSSAGSRFGPSSFGHLGFTGTSLWIDPEAGVVAAILTNRVSPTRANDAIRGARPRAHDQLYALAESLRERDGADGAA